MDYKEKYEQGLECIQEILNGAGDSIKTSILRKRLQPFFPELKEPEDERIRETLIELIRCNERSGYFSLNNMETSSILAWLEKQGKTLDAELGQSEVTKTSDQELEPKFHEHEWIIHQGTENIYQVIARIDNQYQLKYGDNYTIQKCADVDRCARLWTIQDAKDGDVLVDSYSKDSIIILYKGIYKERTILAHCGWNEYNLSVNTNGFGYGGLDNTNYLPATKEQCDLLFQKIKEAGYEWDTEKKELKKIEQKPVDKVGPKFKVGNWYQCTKDFFGKGVTFDKNTAYYCANEGCLQNEYGCHIAIVKDLYDNFKLWTIQDAEDGDVLLEEETGEPFIYNGNRATYFSGYFLGAHCGIYNGEFNPLGNNYCWGKNSCPATKEQRDLLFQKMKDAGYKWDAERKELKRIES